MLPEPALTFTLPSLHDGLVLDCRVYHPLSLAANPLAPPWKRHAAVIAHPYAPMGGCCDDPIVEAVASQLLRKGFLVGTFNFRGAGNSAGRTSWTAKAERDDYTAFVGFIVHYIHYLDPFRPRDEDIQAPPPERPVLLLGGYSYGAMITAHLQPLDAILRMFASPEQGSDAAQIRLRAEHLAQHQNLILGSARSSMLSRTTPRSRSKLGVRVGGDEGGSPRKSHESHGRRSFSLDAEDRLRRSVNELLSKTRHGRHGHRRFLSHSDNSGDLETPKPPDVDGQMLPISNLLVPRPAYLMVSPLQGIVTHLATMSLIPSTFVKIKDPHDEAAEEKLVRNPTLAIYGDKDVFVSASKLRDWTKRMTAESSSQFRGEEISTAGHFWAEEGVLFRMRDLVGGFADELLESKSAQS